MLVVGDSHNDCVHILAIQNLPIMARRWNLLLQGLLSGFMPAVIEIAHCHALDARDQQRCFEQLASSRARANSCKTHSIARCYRGGCAPKRGWLKQGYSCRGSGGNRSRADPHEVATC